MDGAIKKLSLLLRDAKYAVVLTGAGMSTESGIPDFRSKDGWWNKIDPATVATIDALENNYELFREFYKHRITALEPCKPNPGHKILADWEREDVVKCIVTQNIDGFHGEAGSKKVYELHGSINNIRCYTCGEKSQKEKFMGNHSCSACKGNLRPGVVLFGESLPTKTWENAYEEISRSDLIVVMGTSLNVSPVNSLPFVTKGRKVLINMEKTELDARFDLVINERVGRVLGMVADAYTR